MLVRTRVYTVSRDCVNEAFPYNTDCCRVLPPLICNASQAMLRQQGGPQRQKGRSTPMFRLSGNGRVGASPPFTPFKPPRVLPGRQQMLEVRQLYQMMRWAGAKF